ncbi:hypothetical protein B0H14DRAFT_2610787 [Mycena olivaceomarginata]|nr:hypothetical protein B0H14DRAFT_2610787 [Mycena olivaceomarginata]
MNVPPLIKGRHWLFGECTVYRREEAVTVAEGTRATIAISSSLSPTTTTPHLRPPPTRRKRVKMSPDARAQSKHSPANREYLKRVPNGQLMDFRDYEYLQQTGQISAPNASATHPSRFAARKAVEWRVRLLRRRYRCASAEILKKKVMAHIPRDEEFNDCIAFLRFKSVAQPKKLKLKAKERKPAQSSLKKFRKQLRVDEQLAGRFRHHPPSLFLSSSLQDAILDQLLSFKSSSDLLPLLDEWYHRDTHTESLFEVIRQLQADIHQRRDEARKETNRKARATRKAKKRKAAAAVSDSEDADEPDSEHDEHDEDLHDEHESSRSDTPSNDPFPAALLPKPTSRGRKRQALEEGTN